MEDQEENKKKSLPDFHSTTIRLFGIPIFSITKTLSIDEAGLYARMEDRFEKKMTKALEKTLVKNNA